MREAELLQRSNLLRVSILEVHQASFVPILPLHLLPTKHVDAKATLGQLTCSPGPSSWSQYHKADHSPTLAWQLGFGMVPSA